MIDLRSMRLGPGDVRHERPRVAVAPLTIAGQEYTVTPAELEPRLDLQAASGGLYLKLAFSAHVEGPCFRCLEPAGIDLDVRSSEYHSTDPSESDPELRCDYIEGDHRTLASYAQEIRDRKYNLGTLWLPHDGRAANLQTGKSPEEVFPSLMPKAANA